MTAVISRLITAVLLVSALTITLGCGGAAKKADVSELLVQAQQLQQAEKYEDAIRIYRKIAHDYPDSHQGANSQFMVGYIYANHLKDFEQAKIELNRFLDNYSDKADSGLVVGARFELQYMGMDIEKIPALSEMGIADSDTVADTEAGGK
ncbi:MAG TPA: tetratricopeptide repeat protein [Bacteroidetes bacterium]|nr:tetratricopeptide repeat protein [Bacteroidota bacterium]